MAAPLVTALGYFLAPRLIGAGVDRALQARVDNLLNQGIDPSTDPLVTGLMYNPVRQEAQSPLVPRQSGAESLFDIARALYNGNEYGVPRADVPPLGVDMSSPDARTIDQMLSGQGFDTGVPAQAYVVRDGQFLTPMDDFLRYGGRDDDAGRYFRLTRESYGQTDQPATEVRFDQPPGGANGGLAALIRGMHAQR